MASALRRVSWLVALVCCYHAASETPCTVSCATDGTCPDGLSCGADQLCHSGNQDCSTTVNGTYGHQFVLNDSNGDPIEVDTAYGADQLMTNATLADTGVATNVSVGSDSFSFSRANGDEAYRLDVRVAAESEVATETQGSTATLELWSPYYGRLPRTAVTEMTMLTFDVSHAAVSPSLEYVSSTGIRSFTHVSAGSGSNGAGATLDWSKATPIFGAVSALAASDGDVLWNTIYGQTTVTTTSSGGSTGSATYYSIADEFHAMVTITAGSAQTITGAMTATPSNLCATLTLPRQTEITRVLAANDFGASAGSGTTSWGIKSTPSSTLPGATIPIVFQSPASATMDEMLTVSYANPYPESQLVDMVATYTRVATVNGASQTLTYGTTQYELVPSTSSPNCANVATDATIAMPAIATFGGTRLDTDGATISIDRSGPVELDFSPTGGSADDWQTNLYEVMQSTPTALSNSDLMIYSTLQPTVMVDPSLLVQGHMYMFLTESRVGFPNAAQRDYTKMGYPLGTGVAFTSVFMVGN